MENREPVLTEAGRQRSKRRSLPDKNVDLKGFAPEPTPALLTSLACDPLPDVTAVACNSHPAKTLLLVEFGQDEAIIVLDLADPDAGGAALGHFFFEGGTHLFAGLLDVRAARMKHAAGGRVQG
jgi:hypothetical protein